MNTNTHILGFPQDPRDKGRSPRCLSCGYRLVGLSHAQCPECGRAFEPSDPRSYTRRPPYVWYRYWWPGVLLSVGCGLFWAVMFYSGGELGWGLFIGLPMMLGAVLGYHRKLRGRIGPIIGLLVILICALTLAVCLLLGGYAGIFCGLILLVFFVPVASVGMFVGVLCARGLGAYLKQTSFSQREYLPLLIGLLTLPGAVHLAERLLAPPAEIETVQTAYVLDMGRERAWDAWVFYAEVDHDPPMLLRLGLPNPERVEGRITAVGDQEVCIYTKGGRLVKRATQVQPNERLGFVVIEQTHFENNSLRLLDGSFVFEDDAPGKTRVTLTTRYQPLLRPRALWAPIEHTTAHTMHRHVLHGMQLRDQQLTWHENAEPTP